MIIKSTYPFFKRVGLPLLLIGIMIWLKLFEQKLGVSFSEYGIYPRSVSGLKGLLFSQFIHGDWEHLFYNAVPFFLASLSLFIIYPQSAAKTYLVSFFIPGILVWMMARESFHIGLSGVNYSLMAYLFIGGLIRRTSRTLAISLLVVFFYGTMIIGLFPVQVGVSFESHIAGSIVGLTTALIFRNKDPREMYSWEEEELGSSE